MSSQINTFGIIPADFSETLAETIHATNRAASGQIEKVAAPRLSLAKRMTTGLVTLIVAGSMVLGSAAPSLADKQGDNLAKALAAALVIGAIANSIDNNNDSYNDNVYRADVQGGRHDDSFPGRHSTARVPRECAVRIESRGGRSTVYTESCLRRQGFNYRLPNCARSVRIYGKRDRVYTEQCLASSGFRFNGRR